MKKGIKYPNFSGENHPRWKGGRSKKGDYMTIYKPDHPKVIGKSKPYVREHILVVEEKIGRYLKDDETVHHINMDKLDNRPENLWVSDNQASHRYIHGSLNKLVKPLLEKGIIKFEEGEYKIA